MSGQLLFILFIYLLLFIFTKMIHLASKTIRVLPNGFQGFFSSFSHSPLNSVGNTRVTFHVHSTWAVTPLFLGVANGYPGHLCVAGTDTADEYQRQDLFVPVYSD
jgi:hypothetical protein